MTVADNTSRNQYTATSGQTIFAYTFEIVDKGDIVVLKNGTTLSEGTNYTVSNVGNDSGGNVTLTAGATTGDVLTLYRDMPYSRTQNYTNSGDFLASEVNSDFDNLWLAGEQTNRAFSQSIRKPITDSDSISMELPEAATRKNSFLRFDATGAVALTAAGDPAAPSSMIRQQFTGDGTTTVFTLASDPGALGESVQVFIDGIYQEDDTYSISGTSLTFTEAPPTNASIETIAFRVNEIGTTSANLVTYTPAGTGAVQTTVQTKLRESVSVKDFGAVGDGVTDDTAAIQAAIDYSVANRKGAIASIDLTNGTFLISSTINVADDCRLFSSGDKATIKVDGMASDDYAISVSNFRPVYFDNFEIVDTTSSQTVNGMYIGGPGGSSQVSIKDVFCLNLKKAFHFYDVHDSYALDSLGSYNCVQSVFLEYKTTSLRFTNCNFETSTGVCIEVDSLSSNSNCGFYHCGFSQNPSTSGVSTFKALSENLLSFSIENCRFERNTNTGGKHIEITGSGGAYPSYVNIRSNYFTGVSSTIQDSIYVSGIQGAIQNNHFKIEPTGYDIYINGQNTYTDVDDTNTANQARTTKYVKYYTSATLSYDYLNASPIKIFYRRIALPATATGYTETALTLSSFGHLPNITMPTRITRFDLLWLENAYGVEDLSGMPSVEFTSTNTVTFKYNVQTSHPSGVVLYDLVLYGY